MKHWFVLFFGACAIVGCESGSDDDGGRRHRNWLCFEHDAVCSCDALRDGWEGGGINQVDRCESSNCCLFSEVETESTTASCECVNSDNCEAEAATRTATRVVEQCPPVAKQAPVACAETGVNCRPTYLADRGLEGCCDGTLCRENQDGVPVCTPASQEEISAERACRRGISFPERQPLEVLDPLVTTAGELRFDTTTDPTFSFGSGGCLQSVSFELVHAEHPSCTLSVDAGPARDAEGKLSIAQAAVTGDCNAVPELALGQIHSGTASGTLSLDAAVGCTGGAWTTELHCTAGVFELRLRAEVHDTALDEEPMAPKTTITGEPLRLRGRGCAFVFDERCPAGS
jgi:hypothetical protein